MAQAAEDTELRDLVIEALEKNGSLAKIRALLRANIFLAFENECENIKQNVSLDNILKLPEGILCLSIVHEFLEFCNLKNTLFVFMAESRQKKDYIYEGKKFLNDNLNFSKGESVKEPILVTLLKNVLSSRQRNYTHDKCVDNNYKDDQNCTYIVHEDSSSGTSNSQSDNSCDEKNKLHLRLHLDNSDTDTSCDSTRDKSSSEYIPSQHVPENIKVMNTQQLPSHREEIYPDEHKVFKDTVRSTHYLQDLKLISNNSSSDSTSYIDLKPYNSFDKKLINTAGVPIEEVDEESDPIKSNSTDAHSQPVPNTKGDILSAATLSSISSITGKNEIEKNKSPKTSSNTTKDDSNKSEEETEYSYDFTGSPVTKNKTTLDHQVTSSDNIQKDLIKSPNKNLLENPHQNSQSSHSSVSISDVADLISERSSSDNRTNDNKSNELLSSHKKVTNSDKLSDDSGDFSESPIPSISNLSLDIHSD